MKFFKISFILLTILLVSSGCGFSNNNENSNYSGNSVNFSRTSTSSENDNSNSSETKVPIETDVATFSTPLKSGKPERITNIKLTCNKIDGLTLNNGETFSFNQIVGPCTAEEGYKKAEIFVNKQIKYALGGGNCQVSTTLYNAALAVNGITIIERNEHGRKVDYIEDGKDATVSYNTLDLKFRNDTGQTIKLYVSCDDVNVYAKITQIHYD